VSITIDSLSFLTGVIVTIVFELVLIGLAAIRHVFRRDE